MTIQETNDFLMQRYHYESIVNAALCELAGEILEEDMDERIMLAYMTGMRDMRDRFRMTLNRINEQLTKLEENE